MRKGNSAMLRRTEKWYANTSVPHLVTNQLTLVFFPYSLQICLYKYNLTVLQCYLYCAPIVFTPFHCPEVSLCPSHPRLL